MTCGTNAGSHFCVCAYASIWLPIECILYMQNKMFRFFFHLYKLANMTKSVEYVRASARASITRTIHINQITRYTRYDTQNVIISQTFSSFVRSLAYVSVNACILYYSLCCSFRSHYLFSPFFYNVRALRTYTQWTMWWTTKIDTSHRMSAIRMREYR